VSISYLVISNTTEPMVSELRTNKVIFGPGLVATTGKFDFLSICAVSFVENPNRRAT